MYLTVTMLSLAAAQEEPQLRQLKRIWVERCSRSIPEHKAHPDLRDSLVLNCYNLPFFNGRCPNGTDRFPLECKPKAVADASGYPYEWVATKPCPSAAPPGDEAPKVEDTEPQGAEAPKVEDTEPAQGTAGSEAQDSPKRVTVLHGKSAQSALCVDAAGQAGAVCCSKE